MDKLACLNYGVLIYLKIADPWVWGLNSLAQFFNEDEGDLSDLWAFTWTPALQPRYMFVNATSDASLWN